MQLYLGILSFSVLLSPLDKLTRPRLLPERVGLLIGEADDQVVLHHVLEGKPLNNVKHGLLNRFCDCYRRTRLSIRVAAMHLWSSHKQVTKLLLHLVLLVRR